MADEEGKTTPPAEEGNSAPVDEQTTEIAQETESTPNEQPTEGEASLIEGEAAEVNVLDETVMAEGEEVIDETVMAEGEEVMGETPPEEEKPVEGGGDASPPTEKPEIQEVEESAEPQEGADVKPEIEALPVSEPTEGGSEPKEGESEEKPLEDVNGSKEAALPQSEDFDTGEKPEAPINVTTELLSREGTPTVPAEGLEEDQMVRPSTPGSDEEERGVIFEDDEEVAPKVSREELIERYHTALQERETLNQKNHALQHKLAEYFKRKKTEDSRQEVDRNVTDQEQRYMKYISNLEELCQQEASERELYREQIEEMKERKAAKQALVEQEWKHYCDFKRSVAFASVISRTGRPLTMKEFEVYESNEAKKEAEVSQVRLENIKLKNRLRKRESRLKQKEELAEGLHLIDFEQLKIENQTYNEKIEERNEELMKLRKKITSTVQVLTHLKEKLQFVQGENQVARHELGHVEAEVAGKRDILSRTKHSRDALRHDNAKLQQKCGLLGNRMLLRDYEEGTDEIADLSHRLDQLRRTHAELTLSISGVKKKIEQARAQAQS